MKHPFLKKATVACIVAASILLSGCGITRIFKGDASSVSVPPPFSATGDLPRPKSEDLQLLFSLPNMETPYRSQLAAGVEDRCRQLFIQVTMHNSHNDLAAQLAAVETFVSQGGQAVLCEPIDFAPFRPLSEQLSNAGVVLATFGHQAGTTNIGLVPTDYEAGHFLGLEGAGRWLTTQSVSKVQAIVIEYENDPQKRADFAGGIAAGLAEAAPDCDIVRLAVSTDSKESSNTLAALFGEYPAARVILAVDDDLALAALSALNETVVKKTDNYFFGGIGASETAIAILEEGGMFRATLDLRPYETGQTLVDGIQAKANGASLPQPVQPVVMKLASEIN